MPPKKPEPVAAAPVKKVRPTRAFPAPAPHIAEWKQTPAVCATPSSSLIPFTEEAAAAIQGGAPSDIFEDKQPIPLPPALTSMTVHWCRPQELGTLDGSLPKIVETVRSTAGADDAGSIAANGVAFIAKACKAHVCPLDAFNASVMAAMHTLNDHSIRLQTPPLWRSIYPQDSDGNPVIAPSGKYFVKVWCGSGWFLMEVDDRIPCDAERIPLLPRSSDELEIWPHLLVKAALKTGAFGDSCNGSSSSELFSLFVSVLGGWSVVKHAGDLGVRHMLQAVAATSSSATFPFVPVLVGAHPHCDALGRYSLYSHSVFVVQDVASPEQQQFVVTARGAQMKWERALAPAKVDLNGCPLTEEEAENELLAFPKPPEFPDKRRTRQLLLLRDAPCAGKYTWSHSDVSTRTTSALMCFPPGPSALQNSAEWREATTEELKPATAGGRPSLGPHEGRSLVVSNSTDRPVRVIVEVSTQAAPLLITISLNAWATSVLAHIDSAAAAASHVAAVEEAAAAAESIADTEASASLEDERPHESESSLGSASSSVAPSQPPAVVPPYGGDVAFSGATTVRCTGMSCFEITAPPGRAVYTISCACPDMALALGVAGTPPQNLNFGGFCIRFRSAAELQCATKSEVYKSLGFNVQEAFAQAASLDEWVDDHLAVVSLKLGSCVHALLQQLLLPSVCLAPFVTATRFHPSPSIASNSIIGCAPVLIRPSEPAADESESASDHTIIVHVAPPFELKPEAPPIPAILRVVAAPGDSVTLDSAASGVWSEHTGTYAANFRCPRARDHCATPQPSQVVDQASRFGSCHCHRCSAPLPHSDLSCVPCSALVLRTTQVRVYLRCYSPVTCCLAASDTPDGERSWLVEGGGAGALAVQSPLFALQPGAPTVITAYLAEAPSSDEGSVPVAWVLRVWSKAEIQVRDNTEPEDSITKLIASFEDGNAGRSKEAEVTRAAAIAAADEVSDAEAAATALAEALALTDRKARVEALKKAASGMPSSIKTINSDQSPSVIPVDGAQIQALQEAIALRVSENDALSKTIAENRENLKPQLAKWAADLDGRATKTASSDIEKVVKSSLAQRNAFRQAAAVYASHLNALEQSLAQIKLGRNAPLEEGGEETVSMVNLELVEELQATALHGGDWSAAISKVKALGVWPKAPEPPPVDPKKKISPEEQAKTDKEFAEAKLLFDAAAEAPPIAALRSHVGAKLDRALSAAIARLQGEVQSVEDAIKEDAQKRAEAAAAAAAAPPKKK